MSTTSDAATPVTSTGPVRVCRITLCRAEGPIGSLNTVLTFDGDNPWVEARTQLLEWSASAPSDGSVHKTDFTLVYQDGFEYTGCFPLTSSDVDLPAHVRGNADFVLEHPDLFEGFDLGAVELFRARYEVGRRR